MMTQISTEYRGHKIVYSDNAENWWCSDWDYSNVSLAKVRARIDAEYLKLRKTAALDCFEFTNMHSGKPEIIPSKIIEYIGPKTEKDWRTKEIKFVGHNVAAVAARRHNEKAARSTASLHAFMPDTAEAHAALAEAIRLHGVAKDAEKAARVAFDAIPRVSISMIEELVRISNATPETSGDA